MAVENFTCGCSISFRDDGQVGAVSCCDAHANVFSEHKSLRQMAIDMQHQHLRDKHCKPAAPPAETPADAPVDAPK